MEDCCFIVVSGNDVEEEILFILINFEGVEEDILEGVFILVLEKLIILLLIVVNIEKSIMVIIFCRGSRNYFPSTILLFSFDCDLELEDLILVMNRDLIEAIRFD